MSKKAFKKINGMALDMRFLRRELNILVAFGNYYTAMAAFYSVMSDERGVFEIKDRTSVQEDEISDSNKDSVTAKLCTIEHKQVFFYSSDPTPS